MTIYNPFKRIKELESRMAESSKFDSDPFLDDPDADAKSSSEYAQIDHLPENGRAGGT